MRRYFDHKANRCLEGLDLAKESEASNKLPSSQKPLQSSKSRYKNKSMNSLKMTQVEEPETNFGARQVDREGLSRMDLHRRALIDYKMLTWYDSWP